MDLEGACTKDALISKDHPSFPTSQNLRLGPWPGPPGSPFLPQFPHPAFVGVPALLFLGLRKFHALWPCAAPVPSPSPYLVGASVVSLSGFRHSALHRCPGTGVRLFWELAAPLGLSQQSWWEHLKPAGVDLSGWGSEDTAPGGGGRGAQPEPTPGGYWCRADSVRLSLHAAVPTLHTGGPSERP